MVALDLGGVEAGSDAAPGDAAGFDGLTADQGSTDGPPADSAMPADSATPVDGATPDAALPVDSAPPPDAALPLDSAPPPPDAALPVDSALSSVCGNNVRESGEQCDDGNKINLDGCDSACKLEQDHRINWLRIQWGTDSFCPANAFGGAFVLSLVQSQVTTLINTSIQEGSMNILYTFLGLNDLSGTNDPSLKLGWMSGTPTLTSAYNGTSDLDWWYTVDATTINASRVPTAQLNGKITNKLLTAGPGNMTLPIDIAGALASLDFSNAKVSVNIGASSTPLSSTGVTPGHLASEHLNPALVSFAAVGAKTATGSGRLCGNISAASLAAVPVPSMVTSLCGGYTTNNSMLDVMVGGCVVFGFVTAIAKTQPDTHDPTVANVGAGPNYTLSANASTKVVNQCRDKNNTVVNLSNCLNDAAYSAFMRFASGRVIVK